MPIALEPQETRMFWLESDKDKPMSSRPMFCCRAFSKRSRITYERIQTEIKSLPDSESARDEFDRLIRQGIELGVVGWKNFPDDFSIDNLENTLEDVELIELFKGWPSAFMVTGEDRKNSQSPLQSDAGNSASDAPAGSVANQSYPL